MKTELYTAIHLRSIRIAAMALPIAAAFTSILAWVLGIAAPEELPQSFAPESSQFQLQALDITGSDTIKRRFAGSYIVVSVLGVLMWPPTTATGPSPGKFSTAGDGGGSTFSVPWVLLPQEQRR